jgi:serine/threonine-protein kinase
MDEARLAARIRHPNVVSTLDVVSTGEELVVVMEYVHGESLSKLARVASDMGDPISVELATTVIIDALHGLHAAHEVRDETGNLLGVVHRDISPQNLLVGVDGITRIADFGIAKATGRSYETRDGTIKGKLSYMAPEQIERGELTRRTDVFAISVVLWELLTGARLFDGETDAEIMHRVLACKVKPPSSLLPGLPEVYDRILARGLARDPAARYQTARELALELEAVSTHMRPSEVGAWVERIASDTLMRRSHVISKIERALPEEPSPITATKPITPAALAAADGLGTGAQVSWAHSSVSRSSSWLWVAVVAAALGVAAGLFWFTRAPGASAAAAPSVPSTASSPAPALPGAVEALDPAAPVDSVRPATPVEPAAAPSASVSGPRAAAPRPKRSETSTRPQPKPPANCDPPYSIDASGRRIFKMECM